MHYLLNLLFSFFLGPMFMFAAGATGLTEMGGGGGDAGADAGATSGDAGAGGGETITDDVSQADGASGDDGERSADDGTDSLADDPDAVVDLGDGRSVPVKWKKLFDEAKTQGLDKEVKQLFFGQQRLTQKFPGGVNEAVKLADTIQEFGGLEGIGELKSDNEAFQQDAERYMTNPQQWLGETFENNPDAALKAFALSLDYVSEHHSEQYDHLMGKVIVNTLDQGPVHEIYNLLSSLKDNPQAQQAAKKLADFYNGIQGLAKKVPEKKVDAQAAKLTEREQKLATEQEQLRNNTVNSQTIPLLGRQMTTQIEKLAKEAGFDLKKFATEQPEAAQAMRGKILNAVMEKAASDKVFVRNYKSVMKEGNTQRAVKMMNDKHDAILGDIVRQVAKGFGIAKKAGLKPGQQTTTRKAMSGADSGTTTRVNAKPPSNEIDWNKTGNMIYDAKAVLKNGKTVTWA